MSNCGFFVVFFVFYSRTFFSYTHKHYLTVSHEMEGARKKKKNSTAPITHPVLSLHTVVVVDCHVAIVTDTDPQCQWQNFNPPRPPPLRSFLTPHHCYLSSIQSYALIQTGFSYGFFLLFFVLFCVLVVNKNHTQCRTNCANGWSGL